MEKELLIEDLINKIRNELYIQETDINVILNNDTLLYSDKINKLYELVKGVVINQLAYSFTQELVNLLNNKKDE